MSAEDPLKSLAGIFAANRRSASTDPPTTLRDLLSMGGYAPIQTAPPVVDRWFKDQTLHVDGYTFVRCRFDRCQLVTEVATFAFTDCYIAPTCSLYFQGAALKTVRFLLHALRIKNRISEQPGEEGLF